MHLNAPLRRALKRNIQAWLLVLPTFFFLSMFSFWPFIKTIILSFFQKNLYTRHEIFNGIGNYVEAFADPVFLTSIGNNARFSLMVVPLCLVLGIFLAYLLNNSFRGISFFRTAIFYPNVSPMIGFALVWVFLLTPDIGFVDNVIKLLQGRSIRWLGDPKYVLWALSFVYIWREAGYLMIFFLSGLQGIAPEYYEAATIDGAGEWQKFRKITFPLLMPTVVFALTITITNSIKMVDSVIVMTEGGPNHASSMIMYYIYKNAFSFWDQGMAAAFSVIMLGVVLTVVALQYFVLDRMTHYES